ncbi:MAG: hypothetical protein AAES65_10575 [Candidatus Thiodiazotropha sp. (ex. Lucinoma kazani)]
MGASLFRDLLLEPQWPKNKIIHQPFAAPKKQPTIKVDTRSEMLTAAKPTHIRKGVGLVGNELECLSPITLNFTHQFLVELRRSAARQQLDCQKSCEDYSHIQSLRIGDIDTMITLGHKYRAELG